MTLFPTMASKIYAIANRNIILNDNFLITRIIQIASHPNKNILAYLVSA